MDLKFKLNNIELIPLLLMVICTFQLGPNHLMSTVLHDLFGIKASSNPFDNIVESVGAVLLGPICEEILFRGLILQGMLTNYSSRKAIIASAALFGIVHWNIQILGAFLIGLFFGWLYYKTKSLGLTILLHLSANVVALLMGYIKYLCQGSSTAFTLYGYLYIAIAITGCILFYISFRKLYQRKNELHRTPSCRAQLAIKSF